MTREDGEEDITSYVVKIPESLFKRIDDHIMAINAIEQEKVRKNDWFEDAIQEKLNSTKKICPRNIKRERNLNIKLRPNISHEIDKHVSILKTIHTTYSKKKWILEAVYEKLEREEGAVDDGFQKFVKRQQAYEKS